MLADIAFGSTIMFNGQNDISNALTLSRSRRAAQAMVARLVLTLFQA
jgi:hypothetical protein